jgi:hypothetical protein
MAKKEKDCPDLPQIHASHPQYETGPLKMAKDTATSKLVDSRKIRVIEGHGQMMYAECGGRYLKHPTDKYNGQPIWDNEVANRIAYCNPDNTWSVCGDKLR